MILVLFIPALIFESAFSTDYHTILKEKDQAFMLAVPGVVINTVLTGGVVHYFNDYNWFWSFSFMFGAIVCFCLSEQNTPYVRCLYLCRSVQQILSQWYETFRISLSLSPSLLFTP